MERPGERACKTVTTLVVHPVPYTLIEYFMSYVPRFLYVPFFTDEVQYTVSLLEESQKKLADAVQNLTAVVREILNQATQQDDDVSSYEKRTRKVSQRGFGIGIAAIIFAVIAIILSTVAILLALQKRNELSRI